LDRENTNKIFEDIIAKNKQSEWYSNRSLFKELATPFMFSYSSLNIQESKVSIKVPNSSWSRVNYYYSILCY
jgi:hypothetical protein